MTILRGKGPGESQYWAPGWAHRQKTEFRISISFKRALFTISRCGFSREIILWDLFIIVNSWLLALKTTESKEKRIIKYIFFLQASSFIINWCITYYQLCHTLHSLYVRKWINISTIFHYQFHHISISSDIYFFILILLFSSCILASSSRLGARLQPSVVVSVASL